eukprot:TRINITY_DN44813_c0_g1_i1.p1 TRINITY_DN44813_c0_g1~~TRINITY_DN44813_c0_g1_i1.p1  ORF type:complete len:181 (+),score=53.78 TRINITY_DN44813_c0_g1_i1:20-562(+)
MNPEDHSSDEEFVPAPEEERLAAVLEDMPETGLKGEVNLEGFWTIQGTPAPLETNRFCIELAKDGDGFKGTSEVSMQRDSLTTFHIHFEGRAICGPVLQFTLTYSSKEYSRTERPRTWKGTCTALVDPTQNYFTGTYISGFLQGTVMAARVTDRDTSMSLKQTAKVWPPRPARKAESSGS